jgi:hypothetical protein
MVRKTLQHRLRHMEVQPPSTHAPSSGNYYAVYLRLADFSQLRDLSVSVFNVEMERATTMGNNREPPTIHTSKPAGVLPQNLESIRLIGVWSEGAFQ